jgi:excisionase family DNA binding protein
VSDLRDVLGPDLIEALEALIDERITSALARQENGSELTWLSLEEAAAHLRVSPSTIARMLKQGRIRSTYVGRRRLVLREDLDARSAS